MNEIKVNMVKFLMTMFETSSDNSTAVRQFKLNVDELVRRNQIPNSVRNLIYNMYGIANTDTFKPNAQANKLMQINMLMMQLENVLRSGNKNNIEVFKKNIENGVKQGSILKSAADIVFDIYDIQNVTISSKSNIPILDPVIDVPTSSMNVNNNKKVDKSKDKNKDVQIDIAQFKSQFVPEIYYEYENPNYDDYISYKIPFFNNYNYEIL